MKKPILLPAVALALLLTPAAYAQDAAPAATTASQAAEVPWLYVGSDVPVDTSWTFGVLDNGLKYAVKKNVVPQGQVSIRVRIDAGALHEEDDEQGFAHLISQLGVNHVDGLEATTTPTQTTYKFDLPTATPPKLQGSVEMIADTMRAGNISESTLIAGRTIALAEMRKKNGSAQQHLGNAMREHIFRGQRLARRSAFGTHDTIQAASVESLRSFHKRWYRPDKAIVVLVGDAEPVALMELVERHFGDWVADGPPAAQPDFGDPDAKGSAAATIVDPSLPKTATIAYIRPWRQVDDTVANNEQLLVDALGMRIISRRLEAVAGKKSGFASALVEQQNTSRSADVTFVSINLSGRHWEKALSAVRTVIVESLASPPTQAEIDREKLVFQNAFRELRQAAAVELTSKIAETLVRAADAREIIFAPELVEQVYKDLAPKITPTRIHESMKNLFRADVVRVFAVQQNENEISEAALERFLEIWPRPNHADDMAASQ